MRGDTLACLVVISTLKVTDLVPAAKLLVFASATGDAISLGVGKKFSCPNLISVEYVADF